MNKIEKLTAEQEAKMPEYVEKWIGIGSNTDRLDPKLTEKIVNNFRKLIKLSEAPLKIVNNPIEAWVACCLVKQNVSLENLDAEIESVFNGNPRKYDIPKASLPWQSGSFFSATFSFYDYMLEVVGVEFESELWAKYKTWEATSQLGCIYPLEDVTVVCEKPTKICLNEDNVLHCDGDCALEYAGLGDFKIYALNGVRVPEWLALTPANKLEIEQYNTIENADVKAEFVRKVGIERFLEKGIVIDSYKNYNQESHEWWHKSEYELVDMNCLFESLNYAPYLKMVNQTTRVFHLEGVSPNCKTVGDALKERFGGRDFVVKAIA